MGEENGHLFVGDVVDRKDAAGERCEYGISLLKAEEDEEHAGENEKRNDGCAVPGVENAAEGDGHNARDEGADLEEGAHVVDLTAAGEE